MKKLLLIISLLIVSFTTYCQITIIHTDSIQYNGNSIGSRYKFFYNEQNVMFGKEHEETNTLTAYDVVERVVDGNYIVMTTKQGDIFSVSKELNRVKLISVAGKIFVFY